MECQPRLLVPQQLRRLVGIVVDRTPAALSRISIVPGGDSDLSHSVFGEDMEIDETTMILRRWSSGVGWPTRCSASMISRLSRTLRMPRLSETPPSTTWMYGRLTPVAELRLFLDMAGRARGGPGRFDGVDKRFDPGRRRVAAGAAIIVERDGREHHRHGRRCGSGTGKTHRTQIRTERVEGGLRKGQTGARRDVGDRRDDKRAFPRSRSPKVAPLNRISSYRSAAISERPQPLDHREGQ